MDTKILTAIILIIVVIVLAYSPFYKKYQLFYLNKVGLGYPNPIPSNRRYQLIHWIKIRSRCPVSIDCSRSTRHYFLNLNDLFLP